MNREPYTERLLVARLIVSSAPKALLCVCADNCEPYPQLSSFSFHVSSTCSGTVTQDVQHVSYTLFPFPMLHETPATVWPQISSTTRAQGVASRTTHFSGILHNNYAANIKNLQSKKRGYHSIPCSLLEVCIFFFFFFQELWFGVASDR